MMVCLEREGSLLQGGLVSLRKGVWGGELNIQQYKPSKNARNASSANQINK